MAARIKVRIQYTVAGCGSFPKDMLRYYGSEFAERENEDWAYMTHKRRELMLCTTNSFSRTEARRRINDGCVPVTVKYRFGYGQPCRGRWISFQWEVTEAGLRFDDGSYECVFNGPAS